MVDSFTIRNLTTNVVITFNRTTSSFLLDDDSPDWGSIDAVDVTYPLLSSNIGVGVSKTTLNSARPISIIGWLFNDDNGSIEDKKQMLNTFCNPFDSLRITCGDYTIDGHVLQPVVYPSEEKLNNDCICKFIIYITCPFPLFSKKSESQPDTGGLTKSFVFPLVIPTSGFVFGYKTRINDIIIYNKGTVQTGIVIEARTSSPVKGLSFTLGSQVLALKSSYTLPINKTVKISTMEGERGIWLKQDGGEYESAFSILDLSSDWIQLPVGVSTITLDCNTGSISAVDAKITTKYLYYAMEDQ